MVEIDWSRAAGLAADGVLFLTRHIWVVALILVLGLIVVLFYCWFQNKWDGAFAGVLVTSFIFVALVVFMFFFILALSEDRISFEWLEKLLRWK